MGNPCSTTTTNDKCLCFKNDEKVENMKIMRYIKCKWIWSDHHDNILIQCLYVNYEIPLDIINIIKLHTFSEKEEYFIINPIICIEPYYIKYKQLLKKPLCHSWYLEKTKFSHQSILIALYSRS